MTTTHCPVAYFINERIETLGFTQKDIAQQVGFDAPNMITMIKQGHTKLPYTKVGPMAAALETDPVALLKLCIATYQPETWRAIEPMMASALSLDELKVIRAMRSFVGVPFIEALSADQKIHLDRFLGSLKTRPTAAL